MEIHELEQLVRWCELAKTNDKFWQRFIVASVVYDSRTRWAMLALAGTAQSRWRKDE